jgi:hypothetical protein
MEREELATHVRRAIMAELVVAVDARHTARPVLEQLSLVLECAEIAQRIVERLGLGEPGSPPVGKVEPEADAQA